MDETKELLKAIEKKGHVSIITHNDLDGIQAAATCIKALESMDIKDIFSFFENPPAIQEGKSSILDPRSEYFVGGFIIILDLPYHEQAGIWIDHHASESGTETGPALLHKVHDTCCSAAMLTRNFFEDTFNTGRLVDDDEFLDFVDARDIGREPRNAKRDYEEISLAVHADRRDYDFFLDLIDMLVDMKIREVSRDPLVTVRAKRQRKILNRGLRALEHIFVAESEESFLEAIDKESDKETTDETKRRFFFFDGFLFFDSSDIGSKDDQQRHGSSLPYFVLEPELTRMGLVYKFMLSFRGDDRRGILHCTIALNQKDPEVSDKADVSAFAKEKGGGGHPFVAGFTIEPGEFLDALKEALAYTAPYRQA